MFDQKNCFPADHLFQCRHVLFSASLSLLLLFFNAQAQVDPFHPHNAGIQTDKADHLFAKAEAEFQAGQYWQSSRRLITLIDAYPAFRRVDESLLLLANCLCELNMNQAAAKLYSRIVEKHISSPFVSDALLGLQRIAYNNGDWQESLKYHQVLLRGSPSQPLIDLTSYYAGMAYYKLLDFPKCVNVLRDASENSPYYDYILYTKAISLLRMKQIEASIATFNKLLLLPAVNDERLELLDEGHLSLGYLFYELGYYDQADDEFSKIPAGSSLRPAALLASAWSKVKRNSWQEAIIVLTELYRNFPSHELSQEGLFLLGRAYQMIGKYADAVIIYDRLIEIFPEEQKVITLVEKTNVSIEMERKRIEQRQIELLVLESRLIEDLNVEPHNDPATVDSSLAAELNALLLQATEERKDLSQRLDRLNSLAAKTAVQEKRRNWRAYAEYGKARAQFLQLQTTKDGKK
ncbi:MAG: hypothetical protein EHM72_01840 [Calditrichaeota bacterium]|nr:MAG: hypothetical protein EHM72_01840 [Calditrichota bacterium]